VFRIARAEGIRALYDGIGGELLKGFFSHGTTMVSKDIIHSFLVRLYLGLIIFLQRYPRIKTRLLERMRNAQGELGRGYQIATLLSVGIRRRGMRIFGDTLGSGERTLGSLMWGSENGMK